jgi:hypothetical protein
MPTIVHRFPGWSRERPSEHQCSVWCAPPVHAWRVTIARGASLAAFRAWLALFPVRVLAIRAAEADPCDWIWGTRLSPSCGSGACCGVADLQPLVVLCADAGWNCMLDAPAAPLRSPTARRDHG